MHHESSILADTHTSPVVSPPPSSATTLSTQPWQHAAQRIEPAQIVSGHDNGEALQSRKRLVTSTTAPPILVRCGPVPLDSCSDTLALNQEEGVGGTSPQQEPHNESKRRRRTQAVEEDETNAIPLASRACHNLTGADTKAPVRQVDVSWPRPRLQVGWECEGECGGDAPARQTLRVYLMPEEEEAHTYVQVYLSNQKGHAAMLRADRTASGCFVVDLATITECLGQQKRPIAARVRSPAGSLLCMALLHLNQGTLQTSVSRPTLGLSSSPSPFPPFPPHRSTGWTVREARCLSPRGALTRAPGWTHNPLLCRQRLGAQGNC